MKKIDVDTKNRENKGFTLIELLGVIAVLAVILTIIIYSVLNIVHDVKEKSYKVTINNIQSESNNYVLEEISNTRWVYYDSDSEYQCVTVQNLIDTGYFKSDVLDSYVTSDRKVLGTDNIFLLRDSDTKSITKNILLYDGRFSGLCEGFDTVGNIVFVSDNEWAKTKDIGIKYNIYNIDYVSLSNYIYDYYYEVSGRTVKEDSGNFSMFEENENLTVSNNGTMYANIKDTSGYTYAYNTLLVNRIDNVNPYGEIDSTNNVMDKQTVTLKMEDYESGLLEYYFGMDNPNDSDVDWIDVENTKSKTVTTEIDTSGTYYLGVKDAVGNMSVVSKRFYNTMLSINNATVTPVNIITMEGNSFTVPSAKANEYYTFNGWYLNSSYSGTVITEYTPNSDSTLYGKVTENKLTGGVVVINGEVVYGNVLTANITEDTTPKADKYTYQWYTNTTNSTNGGTKLDGETSKTLELTGDTFDKYIYVVVTAKKDNYRPISFNDKTVTKVGRRLITVVADSNSKTYDGKPLTDSGCTLESGTLVFGDKISCKMTSGSTITNVGSVSNVIDSVNMTNDKYYDVITKDGTLTINYKTVTLSTKCNILEYNGDSQLLASASDGYSLSNNYGTDAGTYTITAKLDSNYKWNDGTRNDITFDCGIDKVLGSVNITPSEITLNYPQDGILTYTYIGDGTLSCSSSDENVASCSLDTSNNEINVISRGEGNSTITLSISDGKNYTGASDTADVTVYNTYTVSYYANGCGVAPDSQSVTVGEDVTLLPMESVDSDKIFNYWSTGTNNYSANGTYSFDEDIELYANCSTANKVYIKYNTNGGTVTSTTETNNWSTSNGRVLLNGYEFTDELAYGASLDSAGLANWDNLNYLNISRTGYHAIENKEWVCLSGECVGKTYSDSQSYSSSDFCDASSGDCTVELGVNWLGNLYTVTYVANGGYGSVAADGKDDKYCPKTNGKSVGGTHDITGEMTTQTCRYGDSCTLNKNAYSRQCHLFKGWSVSSSAISADYSNGLTFTYNIDGDLTLYAVWQSNHRWTGIGNQLQSSGSKAFTCGHKHASHGSYAVYCSVCQMSGAHYNLCYESGGSNARWCPCGVSGAKVTFDDHGAFNSNGSQYNILAYSKTETNYYGGLAEGSAVLQKIGDGNLAPIICVDHYTYTITLDSGAATTKGTTTLYGSYGIKPTTGDGVYLYLDTSNNVYSNEVTTSSNHITIPTRTGYTFMGYYTAADGGGTQVLNANGYAVGNLNKLSTTDMTLYAYWK